MKPKFRLTLLLLLSASGLSQADPLDFRAPRYLGSTVKDTAFAGDVFVAVGDAIYASGDGVCWSRRAWEGLSPTLQLKLTTKRKPMAGQPTPEARQDYNALLELLMPFAEQMLKKHGEFFPFGATVSAAGELQACASYDGDETPASEKVIEMLMQGFRKEAGSGKVRATGICYDGRIVQEDGKKVDAVIIDLEHSSGNACKTYVPYTKKMFGGYRFGDVSASMNEPKIFVAG